MITWKIIHLLGIILWMGGLMNITRMLAFHVTEESETQKRLHYIESRINNFVTIPGAVITLIAGLGLLLPQMGYIMKQPWFHAKLTFVIVLIIVHILMTIRLKKLKGNNEKQSPVKFKIMHGLTGLFMICVLIMIYARPWSRIISGE